MLLLNKSVLLGWQVYQIPSKSMFPALQVGDIILADTRPSTLNRFFHQDIIIFNQPKQSNQALSNRKTDLPFYIKRIIAKGGDRIAIHDHQLLLNSQPLKSKLDQQYMAEQLIKPNAFFVVGDNINQSSDSRSWGQLPNDNVVGKFIRVVYRR